MCHISQQTWYNLEHFKEECHNLTSLASLLLLQVVPTWCSMLEVVCTVRGVVCILFEVKKFAWCKVTLESAHPEVSLKYVASFSWRQSALKQMTPFDVYCENVFAIVVKVVSFSCNSCRSVFDMSNLYMTWLYILFIWSPNSTRFLICIVWIDSWIWLVVFQKT